MTLPVALDILHVAQLPLVEGGEGVAPPQIPRHAVGLASVADDVAALERHCRQLVSLGLAIAFGEHREVAAVAVDDLAAVAAGGAVADALGLEDNDGHAALGERHAGRNAGEAG